MMGRWEDSDVIFPLKERKMNGVIFTYSWDVKIIEF